MTTKMPDDCLELKKLIEQETGFALTFEGVHKWIQKHAILLLNHLA
jgi:hypothetical protein